MTGMDSDVPALRRLLDVALALGAERQTEPAMRTVLAAARDLAGAKYAAIGVPDGDGGFGLFLTSGVDSETWDRIGTLPRTHGILAELLCRPETIRHTDITADPRFGYYPKHHPMMKSFLGVPIVAGGEILAELFLAEKIDGGPFTDGDQRLVEMLAAHAALAVVNAQLHERARELSIVEERTRIARDLHDSVTQTLFSLTLVTESAATVAAEPRLAGRRRSWPPSSTRCASSAGPHWRRCARWWRPCAAATWTAKGWRWPCRSGSICCARCTTCRSPWRSTVPCRNGPRARAVRCSRSPTRRSPTRSSTPRPARSRSGWRASPASCG